MKECLEGRDGKGVQKEGYSLKCTAWKEGTEREARRRGIV
jgi:hypothetical protein